MCIETDKRISGMSHMQTSMIFAVEIYHALESRNFEPYIVGGGARSIHLWFKFDYAKYLYIDQYTINPIPYGYCTDSSHNLIYRISFCDVTHFGHTIFLLHQRI